jgi:hypothetical protein
MLYLLNLILLLIPHPHPPASAAGIIGGIGGGVLFGIEILFRYPVNNQRAPPITPPTHCTLRGGGLFVMYDSFSLQLHLDTQPARSYRAHIHRP